MFLTRHLDRKGQLLSLRRRSIKFHITRERKSCSALVFIPTCPLLQGLIATISVEGAPSFPDFLLGSPPLRLQTHRRSCARTLCKRQMLETWCAENCLKNKNCFIASPNTLLRDYATSSLGLALLISTVRPNVANSWKLSRYSDHAGSWQ